MRLSARLNSWDTSVFVPKSTAAPVLIGSVPAEYRLRLRPADPISFSCVRVSPIFNAHCFPADVLEVQRQNIEPVVCRVLAAWQGLPAALFAFIVAGV